MQVQMTRLRSGTLSPEDQGPVQEARNGGTNYEEQRKGFQRAQRETFADQTRRTRRQHTRRAYRSAEGGQLMQHRATAAGEENTQARDNHNNQPIESRYAASTDEREREKRWARLNADERKIIRRMRRVIVGG